MKNHKSAEWIATVAGLGHVPYASGTIASLAGLGLFCLIPTDFLAQIIVTVLITSLGFLTAGEVASSLKLKDPSCVVIDELAGMSIALILVPQTFGSYLLAFILFRFFDIRKCCGIKHIENLPGAKGIMFDDLLSGVYANIITQIVFRFFV